MLNHQAPQESDDVSIFGLNLLSYVDTGHSTIPATPSMKPRDLLSQQRRTGLSAKFCFFGFRQSPVPGEALVPVYPSCSRPHSLNDLGRGTPRHQRKQRDATAPGLHQIASNNLLFAVIGAFDEDVGRNGPNQRQWGKVIKQHDEVHGP
jgi:hypothetical protein